MKLKEITDILGKPIIDEAVLGFIEKYEYHYPKRDRISSANTQDTSYSLKSPSWGVELVFDIDWGNEEYKGVASQVRGSFYPRFVKAIFRPNCTLTDLPYGLDMKEDFSSLKAKLGEPKASHEGVMYDWHRVYDAKLDFALNYQENGNTKANLFIRKKHRLMRFYDTLLDESYESYVKHFDNFYNLPDFLFLRWLVENDLVHKTDENKMLLQDIKDGRESTFTYIKSLGRGYFLRDDLVEDYPFALHANRHFVSYNIWKEFLSEEEYANIWSDEVQKKIKNIPNDKATYDVMRAVWDKML